MALAEQLADTVLIRAKHNRQTDTKVKLFERLRESPVRGALELALKRQSARPKRSKQQARAARAARTCASSLS